MIANDDVMLNIISTRDAYVGMFEESTTTDLASDSSDSLTREPGRAFLPLTQFRGELHIQPPGPSHNQLRFPYLHLVLLLAGSSFHCIAMEHASVFH
jgi:hypothetical protein